MDELAAILTENKLKRGAPQIETSEAKLIIDENDVCVDVQKRERGRSELIIEEFMLMSNTAAARLAKESGVPFVYRIHEDPSPEKVQELVDIVSRLNIAVPHFSSVKPKHLAEILEKTKDLPLAAAVNNMEDQRKLRELGSDIVFFPYTETTCSTQLREMIEQRIIK